MNSMYDDVVQFHQEILGVTEPFRFSNEKDYANWCWERHDFLQEELAEFMDSAQDGDEVEMVDALLDMIYVALGTLYMMGVPVQECWDAVQKANMSKVRGITKRGNKIDAAKPAGWVGPEADIRAALDKAFEAQNDAGHSMGSNTTGDLFETGGRLRID